MIAASPSPTPIAAPRSRPARPDGGGAAGPPAPPSPAAAVGVRGGGGGGAGRAPTIEIGPVSSCWRPPAGSATGSSTVPGSGGPGRPVDGVVMAEGAAGSDLEQLALLVLDRLVDVVHVLGGE